MKTKVKVGEFKGKEIFQLWQVDDEGNEKSERPLIAMGINKLKAIVEKIEDAKEFIKRNE